MHTCIHTHKHTYVLARMEALGDEEVGVDFCHDLRRCIHMSSYECTGTYTDQHTNVCTPTHVIYEYFCTCTDHDTNVHAHTHTIIRMYMYQCINIFFMFAMTFLRSSTTSSVSCTCITRTYTGTLSSFLYICTYTHGTHACTHACIHAYTHTYTHTYLPQPLKNALEFSQNLEQVVSVRRQRAMHCFPLLRRSFGRLRRPW